MSRRKPKTYPCVRVDPAAFDHLGPSLARDFAPLGGYAYLLSQPNAAGLVFVSTSPTGRAGVCAFIEEKCVFDRQYLDGNNAAT